MPALRDLQLAFKRALLEGSEEAAAAQIEGDGLDPRARLAVYRHHILTTLTAVLEAAYPVVCRLVDRRFFGYAADSFIRQHPPAGPCLAEYGAAFPDFLADFPACEGHPYLPDVARLEWAAHRAAHAPQAPGFDDARLRAVSPDDMPRLIFAMDPTSSYLASPWPVDEIWRAHQGEGEPVGPIDLRSGGVSLEVRDAGQGVTVRTLEPVSYAFRDGLARGLSLGEAVTVVAALYPSFDLTRSLRELIEDHLFTDFTLTT